METYPTTCVWVDILGEWERANIVIASLEPGLLPPPHVLYRLRINNRPLPTKPHACAYKGGGGGVAGPNEMQQYYGGRFKNGEKTRT